MYCTSQNTEKNSSNAVYLQFFTVLYFVNKVGSECVIQMAYSQYKGKKLSNFGGWVGAKHSLSCCLESLDLYASNNYLNCLCTYFVNRYLCLFQEDFLFHSFYCFRLPCVQSIVNHVINKWNFNPVWFFIS